MAPAAILSVVTAFVASLGVVIAPPVIFVDVIALSLILVFVTAYLISLEVTAPVESRFHQQTPVGVVL